MLNIQTAADHSPLKKKTLPLWTGSDVIWDDLMANQRAAHV